MPTKSQMLKKDQILSTLVQTRQNIVAEASRLSAEQQEQIFLGTWSVKDLLAHLIGWDHANLDAARSILNGRLPSFYEYRDHDWQTYNAVLVKEYGQDSFGNLLAAMKDSQDKLTEFMHTIPPEYFDEDFGVRFQGRKVTIQRLLEADIEDVQTHLQQIIDFFKTSK